MRAFLSVLVLVLQIAPWFMQGAAALGPVTLQLKWSHHFEFAGYYAARHLGYYEEAGLDVTLREARPGQDVVAEVVSGKAEFGVGSTGLLLERHAGRPVVVLATIFQHSPFVLIARESGANQSIHDLKGMRLMLDPAAAELRAYLVREGVALDRVQFVERSFGIADLLEGRADAISAYVTYEPYLLAAARFRYQRFSPRSSGIDFYGDNIFTTEQLVRAHPERVEAFVAASLRGWQYAVRHPEAIIALMREQHPDGPTAEALRFEAAATAELIRADQVEIGYMHSGRWRHVADVYAEIGMLPAGFPLQGFLYQRQTPGVHPWLYPVLVASLLAVGIVAAIALYILRINRRLRRSLAEVRVLSTAVEQSPASIIITRPDEVIEYVNPQFTNETGYSAEEAIGRTPAILAAGLSDKSLFRDMWATLGAGGTWSGEFINRRKSGDVFWQEARIAPVKDPDGRVAHYVGVLLDITERIKARDRLAHLAYHDVLTGLPNRVLFYERLNQSLALARRSAARIALLMIDVDWFKEINDNFGHSIGDLVLQEIAKRMIECIRDSDGIGRIGGDEFVVLLNDIGTERNAVTIAQEIRGKMADPIVAAGRTLHVTLSIGVAIFPDHGADVTELQRCADAAMYEAKSAGRDRVSIFREGLPEPIV